MREGNNKKSFKVTSTFLPSQLIPRTLTAEDLKRIEEENAIDAHSCRAYASDYGICTCCGAIVSGTSADYELRGYDPPESYI